MVLRGWVPRDAADRTRLPVLRTPAGTVRVEGLAMAELPQPMVLGAGTPVEAGGRLLQRYDADEYARWSGVEPLPIVIRQTSALPDGLVREWVEPGSGVDRHRAYAFQWFAMSATAIVAWVGAGVLSRRRHGRPAR